MPVASPGYIARVTTLNIVPGTGQNVFGVTDGVQEFFNLGFLGAIITTILGSISWQLVASKRSADDHQSSA